MAWHIFRKDLRLLWPLAAAFNALQLLLAVARFLAGPPPGSLPSTPAAFITLLAAALVIVLVVHQDPIPGTRQDWLTRPIRRGDLFLAKLLFIVMLVQGPWLVLDALQGLANGFRFGESVSAAIACAAWVLLTITLPVLAFASMTASMTEAIVAAVGVLAVVIAFMMVPSTLGAASPTGLSGFAWVPSLLRRGLFIVGSIAALVLQYRWRRAWTARALFAAAVLAGMFASYVPWRTAFRVEQLLGAASSDEPQVAVAFAPGLGRFRLAPGQGIDDVVEKPGVGVADVAAENQRRRAEGARTVFLPLRLTGLAPDARLLADHLSVTAFGRDGHPVEIGNGNDLDVRAPGAEASVHQGIRVPGAVFSRIKSQALDVHLEYSFTLLRAAAIYALPARDGSQRMPGVGLCATIVNNAGTSVVLRCSQPGERPSCLSLVLEHVPTRARNPEVPLCSPDYTPVPGHAMPDAISRYAGSVPFYDPSGSIRYPVGGPQLAESQVIVTDYRPASHFARRITIPGIRLQDWEAEPLATARITTP